MTDKEMPYKLSFGEGVQPIDVAWAHVSFLPNERYHELTGHEPPEVPEGYPTPSGISLQHTGIGEREAALLVDVHRDNLEPHRRLLNSMESDLYDSGLAESEVQHQVNIFALGILVGIKTMEITESYARQGIREIESER